jgi:hypothetical protein
MASFITSTEQISRNTAASCSGAAEYFLTRFASAEGKNGGQFYTTSCVVRLLVEMFRVLRLPPFLSFPLHPVDTGPPRTNHYRLLALVYRSSPAAL